MSNKTVNKAGNAIYNIYRGCGWLALNFFILIFLCWGLYASFVGYRVETNGAVTEGYVSELELRDGGTYKAIFKFEVNGQTYTFKDDTSARPPKYEVGETVMVRSDLTNPNLARVDSAFPTWLFPSCVVMIVFVVLIVVNILGWRAWKRGEEVMDLL